MDAVEESLQIHVHHPFPTFRDVPLRSTHRVVRTASRPKAVAVVGKARIESRLQDLQQGLLDETVEHRRNAKLAHPAAALRDLPPQHRLRSIAPRQQLLANRSPPRSPTVRPFAAIGYYGLC